MIRGYNNRETEQIASGEVSAKYPADIQATARRKLAYLDAAIDLRDLASPPGNRLEKLTGDRAGEYSVRINDQWRICFTWEEDGPHGVEIVDYH